MSRTMFSLDFVIKSSPIILYNFLTNPERLTQWFADKVDNMGDIYSFEWDGNEEKATVLEKEENVYIRFKMEESEDEEYLEFKIQKSEVTADTVLIVTDFADDYDVEDQKRLWHSQIDTLTSVVGGSN